MKRSRTVRNTLDDLFCHDSLLEEEITPSTDLIEHEPSDECSFIGLFIDDLDDDEIYPPLKSMRRCTEDDGAFTFSSEVSIPNHEGNPDDEPITPSSDEDIIKQTTESVLSSLTDRLTRYSAPRKPKNGVEDITMHFMSLLSGQTSFVL